MWGKMFGVVYISKLSVSIIESFPVPNVFCRLFNFGIAVFHHSLHVEELVKLNVRPSFGKHE